MKLNQNILYIYSPGSEQLNFFFFFFNKKEGKSRHVSHLLCFNPGEGNGTPLQYSCLENPMDGGAWAAVHGVARVGYDWVISLSFFTSMHWRRKWQPTPVFLPGESQGRRSLVGCHLWGRTRLKWRSSSSSMLQSCIHYRENAGGRDWWGR